MNAAELKALRVAVTRLTLGQRAQLLAELSAGGDAQEVRLLLESRLSEAKVCPLVDDNYLGRSATTILAG